MRLPHFFMITTIHDKIQTNAHRLFQDWRAANPCGYFINCKGPKNSLLHDASCSHLGDTNWESSEYATLADKRKICARTTTELRAWATKHHLPIGVCKHCKRRGFDDKAPGILSRADYAAVLQTILSSATFVAVEEEFQNIAPGRIKTTVSRVIRDTALARNVKELYGFRCQLCGHTIQRSDGSFYAEAHHIRPLGSPHDGPDRLDNLLCVCPNHHVELDYRLTKLRLSDLRTVKAHGLLAIHLNYHNALIDAANAD